MKIYLFIFNLFISLSSYANGYIDAVLDHQDRIRYNVQNVFLNEIRQSKLTDSDKSYVTEVSNRFVQVYLERTNELMEDYQALFIDSKKDDKAKKRSENLEPAIKWATDIALNRMAAVVVKIHKGKSDFSSFKSDFKRISEVTAELHLTNENLNAVKPLGLEKLAIIPMQIRGLFKTVCSTAVKLCVNDTVTNIIESLPDAQFMRRSSEVPHYFTRQLDGTIKKGLPQLPTNASFLITMNHDHSVMDLKYVRKISRKLGIDRNALLTTRDVWSRGTQDIDTLFIQDKNLSEKVNQILGDSKKNRVGVTIYPEGNVPFSATQFPVFAKFGAYIMARKAALSLKDQRPVYLIDIQSNLLQYSTSDVLVPLEFTISEPELVPTYELTKNDLWSAAKRLEFENRSNSLATRGLMVDLETGQFIPGTNTREAVRIPEEVSCQKVISGGQ